LPFKTEVELNDEIIKAGYRTETIVPEMNNIRNAMPILFLNNSVEKLTFNISLKKGCSSFTAITAADKPIAKNNIDSAKNCLITWDFRAPITFRTPTSLALSIDLAVVILIKLNQAITRIKAAIIRRPRTAVLLPFTQASYS
jgi:hypothetical protein